MRFSPGPFLRSVASPDEEGQDFRAYFLGEDLESAVFGMRIGMGLVLAMTWIDYLFFNLTPPFFLLLAMRAGFAALTLLFIHWVRQPRQDGYVLLDRLMLVWWLAMDIVLLSVDLSRPPSYTQNQSLYILIIFACYTVAPSRFSSRFLPAALLSALDLLILLYWKDPMPFQGLAMIIVLTLATHVIGLLLSARADSYRQHQYQSRAREQAARAELELLATTDGLSGLSNRRYFMELLEMELKRFQRSQEKFCLIMLDFDHFKHINDHYGHPVGDEVLRQFGSLLKKHGRTTDQFGRVGGEEFAILCRGTTVDEALSLSRRVRETCSEIKVEGIDAQPVITISMGITEVCETDVSPVSILKRTDIALYRAKEQGRDRVEVF